MQPVPSELSHFALFNLPVQYDLDPADLQRRYLALNRDIHPDMQAQTDDANQELALQHSARINQAYRVLNNPLHRMEHLLELLGGPDSAADKSVPKDLLGKVMQWREEIEDAKVAKDEKAIENMRQILHSARKTELDQSITLARRLTPQSSAEEKARLRQLLNGLKYFDNLLAALS